MVVTHSPKRVHKPEKEDAAKATNTIPIDQETGVVPEEPENAPAPTSDDPRDRVPPERTLR